MIQIALAPIIFLAAAGIDSGLLQVRAEGFAPGTDEAAGTAARADAERAAITQVLESIFDASYMPLIQSILGQAPEYLRSVQQLSKERREMGTWVEIEAYVDSESLRREAAHLLLGRLARAPTALILIAERIGNDTSLAIARAGVAESALVEALHQAGFNMVNTDTARALYSPAELLQCVQGEASEGGLLARKTLAHVAVFGEAVSVAGEGEGGGGLRPNRAEVTVRVICARDGSLVDSMAAKARVFSVDPVEGGSQAFRDACVKLEDDVVVACVLAFAVTPPSNDVLITVEGLRSHDQLRELMAVLAAESGVDDVEELHYEMGLAQLRVQYSGRMAPLVKRLTAPPYASFRLQTRKVVGREATFTAVAATDEPFTDIP